jgi:DNA polymerase V
MSSHDGPAQIVRPSPEGNARKPRSSVAFSFGSPADDSGVGRIDLNDILIRHAQATFVLRVAGNAMRETGIDDGDLVLVDRAIRPVHGHVVIAIVDDGFVCRHLVRQAQTVRLRLPTPPCPIW